MEVNSVEGVTFQVPNTWELDAGHDPLDFYTYTPKLDEPDAPAGMFAASNTYDESLYDSAEEAKKGIITALKSYKDAFEQHIEIDGNEASLIRYRFQDTNFVAVLVIKNSKLYRFVYGINEGKPNAADEDVLFGSIKFY